MNELPVPRDEILSLLKGERSDQIPVFTGLVNVTTPGIESLGLQLSEIYHNAKKLAMAASSSHKLFGLGSAVLPLDMCIESELLGATIDYGVSAPIPHFPKVAAPLAGSAATVSIEIPDDIESHERIAVAIEAIETLKNEIGSVAAIGAWVPGPFTLAMMLIDVDRLLPEVVRAPEIVGNILDLLTELLVRVADSYKRAGADFLTVHEMGGSPGFIGPSVFEMLVLPRLKRLMAALPQPRVLSICGHTNQSMGLLVSAGADAVSVDQLNDMRQSRDDLGPGPLLFGNIDPVSTLFEGDETVVRTAVAHAISSGADAIWPGCDLVPQTPGANLRAMVKEAARHHRGTALESTDKAPREPRIEREETNV
jgi:MtaA/CmuA family methyltransferase|tara:strand:+ start:5083 stop:6183 length:1101 start_codon:yes stop_codon:yes gene_type:complete